MIPALVRNTSLYRSLRGFMQRHVGGSLFNPYLRFAPPGHFYSPLPDGNFIRDRREALFDQQSRSVPGIELNERQQLDLVAQLAGYYPELPFGEEKTGALRYCFANSFFCHGDAIVLYAMLRHFRPRRVIEVGSGYSSAVMLDTDDAFLGRTTRFTFIEPYPDRLLSLLGREDRSRHEVIRGIVQDVDVARFQELESGDILFIDSSHVAKVGSDVVHLLTQVLPRLEDGVIIHVHDIFWPFEYPESWIREGRAWNENYVLKAFLQFNDRFEILVFNSYLGIHHRTAMEERMPLFLRNPGGSLWMRKHPRGIR